MLWCKLSYICHNMIESLIFQSSHLIYGDIILWRPISAVLIVALNLVLDYFHATVSCSVLSNTLLSFRIHRKQTQEITDFF